MCPTHNVSFWRVRVTIVDVKAQQWDPFVLLSYVYLRQQCTILQLPEKGNSGLSLVLLIYTWRC
jgi:hypothetical protein